MVRLKKNKKHLTTVSFDEEIVTKDNAGQLLSKSDESEIVPEVKSNDIEKTHKTTAVAKSKRDKRKRVKEEKDQLPSQEEQSEILQDQNVKTTAVAKSKRDKRKRAKEQKDQLPSQEEQSEIVQDENINNFGDKNSNISKEISDSKAKRVKRKKKKETNEAEQSEKSEAVEDEVSVENTKAKTEESIRAQKRKKHAKLLEEKRLKVEVINQQNALNYLSKWKHCRKEWKFEKLKQIWLQQSMFDSSKIPSEFWETLVEYFSASKGFIRNLVLRDALKIIEKEESIDTENTDENYLLILQRARDIVQSLQE